MNGIRLETIKTLARFDEVRNYVASEHALKNPDIEIEMDKLRIVPHTEKAINNTKPETFFDIEIPKQGTFRMTDWSKKQLGQVLGIRWEKWFSSGLVTADVVQEEIHRRFSKTGDMRKLRTKRFKDGAPGVPGCDGYMRAILTPSYHPIDDERVFDRMGQKFGSQLENMRFMRNHLSKKSSWGNDHCNHYTLVGDPISLGAINMDHPDPEVQHWYKVAKMENRLPEDDVVYPGYHMRNSEVGFTAITIDEFCFRLVCLNGLMVTVGDSRLLYRQHRSISDDEIDKQLDKAFTKAPIRWETTRQKMLTAQDHTLENPAEFLETELKKLDAPKYFREAAIKALAEEPLKSLYGAVQAITRAAQEYHEDMDQRYEFEALGGKILNKVLA
jgi:hypothetical protein